ncbi:class I SAM-dependent methyltransferase [Clostridiales bacterium TF09-2AC]|nr:class I SAM-dependent methyltransferase [Clostridiales bacterium]RJW44192.1 class I SAM-dependent methyltransferase [Clostridiales bacterium TF09-2AC]
MKNLLKMLKEKPVLYEASPVNMWDDPHISKQMLAAHLDEGFDSATRKMDFVRESAGWIASLLPPERYRRLLDLGCGPGIYAELFCHKGYEVTGVDISRRSIGFARESAGQKGLAIQYCRKDYTASGLGGCYDLITLIYCDFGVLARDTRMTLLARIYDSLAPEGALLFDVFKPVRYSGMEETRDWKVEENGFWHEKQYLLLHSFWRYDEDNTFLNQYVVGMEDGTAYYNIWEHTFTFEELERDLRKAGFGRIQFYGNVAGKKCEDADDTICVLAMK